MTVVKPTTIIDEVLPNPGAVAMVGLQKSGKTVLGVQMAMAIATKSPLFGNYPINLAHAGAALIIEKDDPAGEASLKDFVTQTSMPIKDAPFHCIAGEDALALSYNEEFLRRLEDSIKALSVRIVVLDSHTALRRHRSGGDVVKADMDDFGQLDTLAKRCGMTILVIHHVSNGRYHNDWSDRAAGTFAVGAATEAQICIERFRELEVNAPERLVRIRGRHIHGKEMLLRFNKDVLGYDLVTEGEAAHLWPDILRLRTAFGDGHFGPKEMTTELGLSRPTAHRLINNLLRAGALRKHGHGSYSLETLL